MRKISFIFIVVWLLMASMVASADHQPESIKGNSSREWYQLLGASVLSSPHLGVRSQYEGSHLITNTSYVNKDVALLQLEQAFDDYLYQHRKEPHKNIIELSGAVRGEAFVQNPYVGADNSDIDLTKARLDVYARVAPWVKAYISVVYDNALPVFSVTRVNNSNFALESGFVLLGNFNMSPWYSTLGQLSVPFGQYSTYMISDPLTENLGLTLARALVLGYQHYDNVGLHGSVYAFHGDSKVGVNPNKNRRINHFGADLGYRWVHNGCSVNVVASFINNLTDAQGMQSNSSTGFSGFGATGSTAQLEHRVPGVDARLDAKNHDFFVLAEWVVAVRRFNPLDMTFNGEGAKPHVWHTEVGYQWKYHSIPMGLAAAYDRTHDSLALNIPKQQMGLTLSGVLWQETVLKLEYRHDRNYRSSDVATGAGVAFIPSAGTLGKSRDTLTSQLTVYF